VAARLMRPAFGRQLTAPSANKRLHHSHHLWP
jgi:hypothetical protein